MSLLIFHRELLLLNDIQIKYLTETGVISYM